MICPKINVTPQEIGRIIGLNLFVVFIQDLFYPLEGHLQLIFFD